MTIDPADWHTWLANNPRPDLQKLVAAHGTYDRITPEAWAQWDVDCAQWESARRDRLLGSHTWATMKSKK